MLDIINPSSIVTRKQKCLAVKRVRINLIAFFCTSKKWVSAVFYHGIRVQLSCSC